MDWAGERVKLVRVNSNLSKSSSILTPSADVFAIAASERGTTFKLKCRVARMFASVFFRRPLPSPNDMLTIGGLTEISATELYGAILQIPSAFCVATKKTGRGAISADHNPAELVRVRSSELTCMRLFFDPDPVVYLADKRKSLQYIQRRNKVLFDRPVSEKNYLCFVVI